MKLDGKLADLAAPDSTVQKDTAPDMAVADAKGADRATADALGLDAAAPDTRVPDQKVPDQTPPDAPSPTCTDGKKNGVETDLDCGGICPPCGDGKKCGVYTDCKSSVCSLGVCAAPSCTDSTKNGAETDVDCGGGTCPACADGKKCGNALDCSSTVCIAGTCAKPSCSDKVKNGAETDMDCGGGTCPACADSKKCVKSSDCQSGICSSGVCSKPNCTDKVQNGAETDVDCGGGTCPACASGQSCVIASDCQSSYCKSKQCHDPGSCKEIQAVVPGAKTGTYTIAPVGFTPFKAYCDMASQGGGWTLVANYPIGTTPAVPKNWSGSASASGSDFSSPNMVFKMSDLAINTLKTVGYKAIAEAKNCYGNPSCAFKHTLYFKPTCVFASTGSTKDCHTAYLDVTFKTPTPVANMGPQPCSQHWGLVDVKCGTAGALISHHQPGGFVVCVGSMTSTPHACNGRNSEQAGVQIWVR